MDRGDGLDRVRAADCVCAGFGETEMFHLACSDQLLHRAGCVLDGYVWVDTMLVEQVDRRHLQPLQHRVDDLANVLWSAVDSVSGAIRVDPEAELRRDHHPLAKGSQRLADELLVG